MGVLADVPAVDRILDYLVPVGWLVDRDDTIADGATPVVRIGSVVRVPLGGRRVRGWVVAIERTPPPGITLRPLAKVTGRGPAADVFELADWAAWRWAGRRITFLRAATPQWAVGRLPQRRSTPREPGRVPALIAEALASPGVTVLRLPPATDPLGVALAANAMGQALLLCPGLQEARSLAARLQREGITTAHHPEGWPAAAAGVTVVGSRAAAWAPAPQLAAVVVFDEHDRRYRDERAPTWNARDVVVERARRAGVPAVLVSATPSLEALTAGRLLAAGRTEERAGWPMVEVVDLTKQEDPDRAGRYTPALVRLLRSDARTLILLNRTGRSKLVACAGCSALQTCETCGTALALPNAAELICPRCGAVRPVVCLACGSTRLKLLRPGVARVAQEIAALAGQPVAEVEAKGPPPDPGLRLIVGTEAALYRHGPFQAVAFLDFDQELTQPHFRATEAALALLGRAAAAVGSRGQGGRILIQTRLADHPVVHAALLADPGRAAAAELARRTLLGLPPARALARISGPGAAHYVAALAAAQQMVQIQGPVEEAWLVRGESPEVLADALAAITRPAARMRVEVDPDRV